MKLSLSGRLPFRNFIASQKNLGQFFSSDTSQSLYKRISPLGYPNISVVPVLEQWVQEGRPVLKGELERIIIELKVFKRFKHALEISHWMTDRRYFPLSTKDNAMRLNLILKVHGLEQVENYFNLIPKLMKGFPVYTALLSCYAKAKSVEKAEHVMQQMKNLGFVRTALPYNILINLHSQTGEREKIDALVHEMEERGIYMDRFSYGILLNAYAVISDIEGIDKIIEKMESDPRVTMNCIVYASAANGYLNVGLPDKALAMVKKMEGLRRAAKRRSSVFDLLLKLYARVGKKDDLYRIWILYKEEGKIYNRGYKSMISSLLILDDIKGALKIFEEWESRNLSYDFSVPNLLIDAYCEKGLLGNAESLVKKAMIKGDESSADCWYYSARWYLKCNQIIMAVESVKKAIAVSPPGSNPSQEALNFCLECLKRKGNSGIDDQFLCLLRDESILSTASCDKLLNDVKVSQRPREGLEWNEKNSFDWE
ncbi:Pentatricopeptide repeat-containing protein [Quillaja saponaria]|uniref:Pentatricopeptide repeat-containing protein n=1 Tax=Quillaja saponaria TaxID=32244 RepID=A0AAD7P944_QUISA|nr:Pentatricopeptide repeat-containing protein [Quillaja saponaria]